MRYYDLLSFSEQLCLDKKHQRKLKHKIMAAKQKLIFYLSYLKSKDISTQVDLWQPERLNAGEFVKLFANDRMYQKISKSQKVQLRESLLKSRVVIKDITEKEEAAAAKAQKQSKTTENNDDSS